MNSRLNFIAILRRFHIVLQQEWIDNQTFFKIPAIWAIVLENLRMSFSITFPLMTISERDETTRATIIAVNFIYIFFACFYLQITLYQWEPTVSFYSVNMINTIKKFNSICITNRLLLFRVSGFLRLWMDLMYSWLTLSELIQYLNWRNFAIQGLTFGHATWI